MFEGRTRLRGLVKELVEAVGAGTTPVLVVEGCGGSGKTALLTQTVLEWQDTTPTVLVRPRELRVDDEDGAAGAVRPVLAAVLLGLSAEVPGFPLSFERVLLAQIAMRVEVEGLDQDAALDELNRQTNNYRERNLRDLIRDLAATAGSLIQLPLDPGPMVNRIADYLGGMLESSRRASNFRWSRAALEWFGHQDQGLGLNADRARLRLSAQARSRDPDVRRDVDDLLVAALLADLRHSLAPVTTRLHNVVMLLDDGDIAVATTFVRALLRVRRAVADRGRGGDPAPPDPLLVMTTSGGLLAEELADDELPAPELLRESEVDISLVAETRVWVRIRSEDLTGKDVVQLAKGHLWPNDLAASTVGKVVYGLSRGHPKSVDALLRRLHDEPSLARDPGKLLRGVENSLLEPFVREFSAGDRANKHHLRALVTLSAALTKLDAQTLAPLLPDPVELDSPLYSSSTLWTSGDSGQQQLPPLVRHLGMRLLSARVDDDEASWAKVIGRLRDHAGDEGPRLRYTLLLGDREAVAEELLESLEDMATRDWLELFDLVTSDVNPRETAPESIGTAQRGSDLAHTYRLLGVVPAFDHDPCSTEPDVRQDLAAQVAQALRQLSNRAQDPALLLRRAQRYERFGRNYR
ncbi:hypothetical protein [Saccharothrix longispora]|uniref:hypothetical protein n=1 Tax=Saccharothrix longispora TaxID=33920 RepID=UPI0028FD42E1|nr:hypothetical protein [Saccharothrix longispora]MDU0292409.1 hypothetical protein [Saccharothrix longispora]